MAAMGHRVAALEAEIRALKADAASYRWALAAAAALLVGSPLDDAIHYPPLS